MTMFHLRGVKTRLGSDSTSVEVTECNQVYRQSLEQITYLQVKVIGGTSIHVAFVCVRERYNTTHTHTDGTDGPWRASEIQCMCLPSFVDVWVCRLYQRVYMLHQSYCFATSFRIDIRSKATAFSELLARSCLIGNLVNCKSYARDWIDSVSSRWRRRGGRRWNWLKLRNKSTIKFIQPRISVKLKSLPWHEPFWVDIFKQ